MLERYWQLAALNNKYAKKAFLAIKYFPDNSNRSLVEEICKALELAGWQTFVIVRDKEKWGERAFSSKQLMEESFEAISNSNSVFIETSEKGVGIGIEAGFAYAIGKPIIVLVQAGKSVSSTLQGIAYTILEYKDFEDLNFKLSKI